jgi:hypothetical protein
MFESFKKVIIESEDAREITSPNSMKIGDVPASVILSQRNSENITSKLGIGNTELIEAIPIFNKADCENVLSYHNLNCSIVFGRDRPSDRLSGYGGAAVKRSAAIDIVVGRMGPNPKSTDSTNNPIFTENNYTMDAARIVISQRTNLDHNFRIRSSLAAPSENCSGIGIKADSVRIIGRKDIKIVSGTDFYDSHGNAVGVDYPIGHRICLIGDNRDDLLQPLVKGENLQGFLVEITDAMHHIISTLESFVISQNALNMLVLNHTHRDSFYGNVGLPSQSLIFNGYNQAIRLLTDVKASTMELTGFIEASKARYILVPDDGMENSANILSSYVFCN